MAAEAAIGFRAHSGWAAAVAVTGAKNAPVVIARRRIEMRERGASGPSQPYHAVVGLAMEEAAEAIARSAAGAAERATASLRAMVADLGKMGQTVCGCGLLLASGRPLPPLEKILGAHPLLHTAEGELFRAALRVACGECGLRLLEVREREVWERAGSGAEEMVAAMGKGIGAPWRQDEKLSALAGWLALGEYGR